MNEIPPIGKKDLLKEKIERVKQRKDRLGKEMDPEIIEPVALLNLLNIPTSGSCEGHLYGGLANPWIDINTLSDAKDQEGLLFEQIGILVQDFNKNRTDREKLEIVRIGGIVGRIIVGEKEPISELSKLKDPEDLPMRLQVRQSVMKDFTEFLKTIFLNS